MSRADRPRRSGREQDRLRIPLGELTSVPGVRTPVSREASLGPVEVAGTRLDPERSVVIDGVAEAIGGGVVVEATVEVPWIGECRRCLGEVTGTATADVREIFEARPTEGETYPLGSDTLDLEPMVRDAALLAVPLAPVCTEACEGPDPERFPTGPPPDESEAEPARDPRWAALDQLRDDR